MVDRILVPHDGGASSDAALRFAFEKFPDASVVVLYVVEPFAEHTEAGMESRRGDWREHAREYADEVFEGVRTVAEEFDATVDTEWRYGRPRSAILDVIEDRDVDHVVMGNRGREGLERVLLGSVAEATVRRSPIPVTVVHETER